MLQSSYYKTVKSFSTRKVSTEQAIRVLRRNGINVNKEKAEIILDFLYLIAKTYRSIEDNDESWRFEPKREIEHRNLRSDVV
jgi:hypothetical protein